jgi:hypothetical protein
MRMVTSALRAYSTAAADRALRSDQPPPAKLTLKECPLLNNNLTAVMKQLHQQGLKADHQRELNVEEFKKVLQAAKSLPVSSFKHVMRGVLILSTNWGGRVSEYSHIKRRSAAAGACRDVFVLCRLLLVLQQQADALHGFAAHQQLALHVSTVAAACHPQHPVPLCLLYSRAAVRFVACACSDLVPGTDRDGNKVIKFTVPNVIKQQQGGPSKSSGQRLLDHNPEVNLYPNDYDSFLCPFNWLKAETSSPTLPWARTASTD